MKSIKIALVFLVMVMIGMITSQVIQDTQPSIDEQHLGSKNDVDAKGGIATATSIIPELEQPKKDEDVEIVVVLHGPADLLIIDEAGNQTGFVGTELIEQIRDAEYATKEPFFSGEEFKELSYDEKKIVLKRAGDTYDVRILGTESEQYSLKILIQTGRALSLAKDIVANTAPGQVDEYQIDIARKEVFVQTASYQVIRTETVSANCVESKEYYAVTENIGYQYPTDAYVYKKDSSTLIGTCERLDGDPVFTMRFDDAEYLGSLLGNFLILDIGTGPSRSMAVYNLLTKEKVLADGYGNFVILHSPDKIGYWKRLNDVEPTPLNCPNIAEIKSNYFVPEIQEYVVQNLLTGTTERKERRCEGTQ